MTAPTFTRAEDAASATARAAIGARIFQRETSEGAQALRAEARALEFEQQRENLAEKLAENIAFNRADPWTKAVIAAKRAIIAELPEREDRRHAERALADYIRERVLPLVHDLDEANELAHWCTCAMCCRVNGTLYATEDGSCITMWDSKCGKSRLCPDEAREEMMRLAVHYGDQIVRWRDGGHDHRVFTGVLTFPHAEPGRLRHHLRYLPQRFKDLILDATRKCTDADRKHHGYSARKKLVHRFRPGIDSDAQFTTDGTGKRHYTGVGIHGALIVVEAPLSADGKWNVHVNFLLLVKGRFDYQELYDAWRDGADHINLEVSELNASDPHALACALRELIKYAAAHTGTKSAEKAAQGRSKAPPMTAWAPELWLEWWRAHKDYRRARAYGCLYNAPAEAEEEMPEGTPIGRIKLDDAGGYWVDLIPDDKFSRRGLYPDDKPPPLRPPRRPPGGT